MDSSANTTPILVTEPEQVSVNRPTPVVPRRVERPEANIAVREAIISEDSNLGTNYKSTFVCQFKKSF